MISLITMEEGAFIDPSCTVIDPHRLTLRKGRNVLRGAVINGPGLSDFCVRFLDAGGRPITDLTIDVR